MVTVASRCSSSIAIGLPTMSLRPMTTAWRPRDRNAFALEQLDDAGRRAGHELRPVLHEQPDALGAEPVHVFLCGNRVEHTLLRAGAHRFRQRRLHEDAVVHRAAIQPLDQRQRRRPATRYRASARDRREIPPRCQPSPCAARRPGRPDRCRPARCRAPAGVRARAVNAATCGLISSCIRAASACPSRIRAAHAATTSSIASGHANHCNSPRHCPARGAARAGRSRNCFRSYRFIGPRMCDDLCAWRTSLIEPVRHDATFWWRWPQLSRGCCSESCSCRLPWPANAGLTPPETAAATS